MVSHFILVDFYPIRQDHCAKMVKMYTILVCFYYIWLFWFVFIPILTGCHPDIFLKDITEIMPVVIPYGKTDLRRAHIRRPEQFLGLGDPKAGQVAGKRYACFLGKHGRETAVGHACRLRRILQHQIRIRKVMRHVLLRTHNRRIAVGMRCAVPVLQRLADQ